MSDGTDLTIGHHDIDPTHAVADPALDAMHVVEPLHPLDAPGSGNLGELHGAPAAAAQDWFLQKGEGYCLPASLTEVLSEVTGQPIPDESVVDARLTELGMPPGPDGLPLCDGVALLQSFGVNAHIESGNISDLEHYLDQGRGIVLAVNADDIWYGHNDPSDNLTDTANHALIVTAIDDTRGVVVLSDPGNPAGNEETVPLAEFEQAWAASGNEMLVTYECVTHTDQPAEVPPHTTPAPGPVLLPMTVNGGAFGDQPAADPGAAQSYTVHPGDTLWDIAERVYGDGSQYPRIAAASGITNPALIYPGETLTIPQ
jgi:hypothetical protein